MNAPQHLHRSSAMGSTVGHIPANSWASCLFLFFCDKMLNATLQGVFTLSDD